MAVDYPRSITELIDIGIGFEECQFTLQRYQAINTLHGGVTQVREYAQARWRCSFVTTAMRLRRKHDVEAWWDSLRGGLETFLAYDVFRPRPVDDAASTGGISAGTSGNTAQRIDLTGLGSVDISNGDYIGLRQSGAYGLFKVTNGGSGSSVSAFVEPAVMTDTFTGAATVDLVKPQGEFLPEQDSFSMNRVGSMFQASFSGIQKLF